MTGLKTGWAAAGARSAMLTRALPDVTGLESLENLGKDLAQNAKDITALRAVFGGDAEFASAAARWERAVNLGRGTVAAGQGIDLTNHAISKSELPGLRHVLPGVPSWEHFKDWATHGIVDWTPVGGE